jgi:chemotaxis protein CheD
MSATRISLIQGEYYVTADPNVVVSTLLGSCVAACLHDPLAQVGGISHFLLPGETGQESERVAVHLMELLVNAMLKNGASRDRMQAKIFGGAKSFAGLKDIGAANSALAQRFLEREGIVLPGGSTGGSAGRCIEYWPASGRARQKMMVRDFDETPVQIKLPHSGELELF